MSKYINYRGEEQEEMIVRADSVDDMLAGKWRMLEFFVRCKECRHNMGISDEDYCAWGEPREIEDERTVTFYSGDRPFETVVVRKQPTVNAEPVRHGHWIFNPKDAIEMMFTLPKCSECGAESSDCGNYCPNCGAKMDEVIEDA